MKNPNKDTRHQTLPIVKYPSLIKSNAGNVQNATWPRMSLLTLAGLEGIGCFSNWLVSDLTPVLEFPTVKEFKGTFQMKSLGRRGERNSLFFINS